MPTNTLYSFNFNIAIVDDHDCILQGITSYLKRTFVNANIQVFTEGTDFLNQSKAKQMDVCIVDLQLQDIEGIKVIKSLKKLQPLSKVIVYTMHDELWVVKTLMNMSDVDGVVLKNSPLDSLRKAVEEVYKGEKYYCQKIKSIKQEHKNEPITSMFLKETFSDTYLEIIKFIAKGLTSQQIADKMGHTKNTIMSYKKDIFRKFGVNSAAELVVKAIYYGLINKKDLL